MFNSNNRNEFTILCDPLDTQIQSELRSISVLLKGRKSVRIVETSIHLLEFKQILVIDLDSTYPNEPGRLTV